jgi:hypothetical protein
MTPLLTAIDHLLVASADFEADVAHYARLLGTGATAVASGQSSRTARFHAVNLALHLQAGAPDEAGLTGLCLRCSDLPRLRRRLARLGLISADYATPGPVTDGVSELWLEPDAHRAYRIGFTDRTAPSRVPPVTGVTGLDHVVVASRDATRTAFLFAAQLGLDLRMDLSRAEWNARLLFFRCGDTIVEVVETLRPDSRSAEARDTLYGLSWRVARAAERRAELAALGFDVSPVRRGRKPGTQVFTVRDGCAGVATLMLQPPA